MSEIKPIRLPVRYDHSSSLLIEADGGPIADCLTNHEIGEQIAAALNAHEQLAEAKGKVKSEVRAERVRIASELWKIDWSKMPGNVGWIMREFIEELEEQDA